LKIKFRKENREHVVHIKAEQIEGTAIDNPNTNRDSIYFVVTISDNGIGFEDIYKRRIFEIFQRLHGKAEYPGTGIGLSICKKIVEAHGGTISATGELARGATFTINLPVSHKHSTV